MSYYQVRGSALRRATRTLPPRRPWRLRAAGVAGARSQKTQDARQPRPWALRAAGAAPRYPRHRSRHCPPAAPDRRGRPGAGVRDRGALPRHEAPGARRHPPAQRGGVSADATRPLQPCTAAPSLGGRAKAPARPHSPGRGSPSQGRGSAALAGGRSGARRPPAAARPRQWAGAAPAPAPRLRRSALCAAGGPRLLPPSARRGPCGSGGSRWGRWSPLRVSAGCGLPSLRSGRPCPPPPPRAAQPVPRRVPPGASATRLRGRRAPRGGALGAAAPPLFRVRPPRFLCSRPPASAALPTRRPAALPSPPCPVGFSPCPLPSPRPRWGRGRRETSGHRCGGDEGCPFLPRPALPALPILRPASRPEASAGGDLDTGREISDKRAKRGCRSSHLTVSHPADILIP